MINFYGNDGFYSRLQRRWREVNETYSLEQISALALDFTVNELGFQKAILFVHDDDTGLFRASVYKGYCNDNEINQLKIIQLLLSGEIIQTLRQRNLPIIHTSDFPNVVVDSLLKNLFFGEAILSLFGGDVEVPHGIIVVGNGPELDDSMISFSRVSDVETQIALQNLVLHLSGATNAATFYRAWNQEKLLLEDKIELRTQEIREQKEQFEAIYKTSKDGIAVLDVHTTAFLDANPAYLEMLELTHAELLRTSCLATTIQKDLPASLQALSDVCHKGFVRDFVKTCLTKSGREVTVNMSLALMHGNQHILVTAKDMTSRYQLERELVTARNKSEAAQLALEQKNNDLKDLTANLESLVVERTEELATALIQSKEAARVKSEFLANMSHEIRTPMNGLLGMAELLASTKLTNEQEPLLRMLQSSGQSLLTIINDILDFSKIEAGKLNIEKIPFNFHLFLGDLKDIFSVQAHARGIEFSLSYSPDLPRFIIGDAVRLRQIFFNLISNALKFTHKGQISIEVIKGRDNDTYQVSVSDTGIGMSSNVQAQIFNAFIQANPSITRKYGGTGLGLVISEKLVKLMGGDIWVESEIDKGSTFYFSFSALTANDLSRAVVNVSRPSIKMGHLAVLLVEDNYINQQLVLNILKNLDISPDVAHDGLEALRLVKKNSYDVVLMDLQMPNMDGLTATTRIREMSDIQQPYIIALTANAFAEDKLACHSVGMNDFVSKPVSVSRMVEVLSQVNFS